MVDINSFCWDIFSWYFISHKKLCWKLLAKKHQKHHLLCDIHKFCQNYVVLLPYNFIQSWQLCFKKVNSHGNNTYDITLYVLVVDKKEKLQFQWNNWETPLDLAEQDPLRSSSCKKGFHLMYKNIKILKTNICKVELY